MSELITVDGLVTRVYPHGDHDRLIHVVTPDRGRLPVMVKGGQSKRNPMAAYTQLFTYGNYELYRKGELYWLRGGSVNHAFYELSCDVTRMALGAYLCDVTSDMTAEGNPDMDETAVPVELVTCSGSGLDPHISPAAAEYQIPRVAKANGMTEDEVRTIVEQCTSGRFLGLFGEETVNVLKVNLMLDGILK